MMEIRIQALDALSALTWFYDLLMFFKSILQAWTRLVVNMEIRSLIYANKLSPDVITISNLYFLLL